MGVVFVGGVHGVGKTTACEAVATRLGYEHHTASALIRAERASAIAEQGKAVANIAANQDLLVAGFERVQSQSQCRTIILDGHFTLWDASQQIQSIPVGIFRALKVEKLVCFCDEPTSIASRLRARDVEGVNVSRIAELQEAELEHANQVASQLRVSLTTLIGLDPAALMRVLETEQS